MATIRKSLNPLEVSRIEEKLQKPCTYKNVALVAHQHFLATLPILEEMQYISENILSKCHTLEEDSKPTIQATFSLAEIKDTLRQQYRSLKSQQEISENKLAELRMKVIIPIRAMLIAKNIFLNGDLKKLNAERRKYEKAVKKFNSDLEFFSKQKLKFENTIKNYAEKFQHSYFLIKSKIELETREQKLKQWKNKLEQEEKRQETLCTEDAAKEKIGIIAASILRKNLPHVKNFEKEKKKLASIKQILKLTRIRLDFISDYPVKKKYFYRILDAAKIPKKILSDQNAIISIISDALRGENYAVQLVARFVGNNLEMEKDWELMSNLDTDELLYKQIFRNL